MARQTGRVTLHQIAAEAGVSKSTVSLVLNGSPNAIPISEATRQKVVEAAERLGYRPNAAARSLVTGRANCVLMVSFDLWDENFAERLRGVEAQLTPIGFSILVSTVSSHGDLQSISQILRSGQADGVLLTGIPDLDAYGILQQLRDEAESAGVPMVGMADGFPRNLVEHVADIDDCYGGRVAVEHLIEHGHRRIMFLGCAGQRWSEKREEGYREALAAAGIPIDERLVALGSADPDWSYDTVLRICKTEDFTAMFAVTDRMAIAALAALRVCGRRTPEDCAVIGYDNIEALTRYSYPPMTTVAIPFYETGRSAARMLLDLIETHRTEATRIPVRLVVRESCGCPPIGG